MEDWLGITKIENDALGRAEKVIYPDGREVSYTYGKGGERTSITYPDGRTIHYGFDESLRLSELKDGDRIIRYAYDKAGRLTEKSFPNGMRSTYRYDRKGQVTELRHEDKEGVLDRYAYQYDLLGNKTGITQGKKGAGRGKRSLCLRLRCIRTAGISNKGRKSAGRYGYDAFGNRTALSEKGQETAYAYNALNQLVSKKDVLGETSYRYDRRGNLIQAIENGDIRYQYTYGALNRLERAVSGRGETASYQYNGLGYRTGKTEGRIQPETLKQMEENLNPLNQLKAMEPEPEKTIRYTIDLTRNYHNLLEREENQRSQIYLWDGNAAGFYDEGEESPRYYLQDELGSPLRIEGEDGYLRESYGYDEFGCDLYGNQGKVQPFGYTGYQHDGVAGTYFAQAREYQVELGRFDEEDSNKGYIAFPETLCGYVYCFNKPFRYIDLSGKWITIAVGAVAGGLCGLAGSLVSEFTDSTPGINWKNVVTDVGTGIITGGIAGTGIGLPALIGVGASAGGLNYVIKEKWNGNWNNKTASEHLVSGIESMVVWGISTAIGGKVATPELANLFAQLEGKMVFSGMSVELSAFIHAVFPQVVARAAWGLSKVTFLNAIKSGLLGSAVGFLIDYFDLVPNAMNNYEDFGKVYVCFQEGCELG